MTDQPTPKPMTERAEAIVRGLDDADMRDLLDKQGPATVQQLLNTLDASRAETAALRAALQGIKDYGWDAMEPQALEALSRSMALSESGAGGLLSDRHRAPNTEVDRPDNASSLDTITSLRAAVAEAEKSRDALAAELAEARKVLDRLPKTADGVPIEPGMKVTVLLPQSDEDDEYYDARGRVFDSVVSLGTSIEPPPPGSTGFIGVDPNRLYSTREAALAARDSGKASGGGVDAR